MKAIITKSPNKAKKWRAHVTTDTATRHVDFGSSSNSDYTIHKDAHRMSRYVRRHGAKTVDLERVKRWSPAEVHRRMKKVSKSATEKWTDPMTPGYWSRWLLWSEPSLNKAAKEIQRRDGIDVTLRTNWDASEVKRTR